jgi:thioredoxin 1
MVIVIANIDKLDFEKEVLNCEKPAIIKFCTFWDSICRAFSAAFEELAKEYSGKISFFESNTDGNPDLAEQNSILQVPSIIIFYQGKEIKRMVNPSKALLRVELENALRKVKKF